MAKQCWMIEGKWTGPQSPAGDFTRIVHREYTRDRARADACRDMRTILYTDGTRLILRVTPHTGKKLPANDNYGSLISDCIRAGVTSVDELYAKETP